jgi:hypothetical protein
MDTYVLTGVNKPGAFELAPGLNRLGRNPTNDFRVHDSTVSSFHCEITVKDTGVIVRDLESTNGTFIDGRPVQEAPLQPGQILTLGSAEFRLDVRAGAPPEPPRVAIPTLPVEKPAVPPTLANGTFACLRHPTVPAGYRCTRCGLTFCEDCVRVVGRPGGQRMTFCPECSGLCDPLPAAVEGQAAAKPKKQSFLGRLTQTIRIRLR